MAPSTQDPRLPLPITERTPVLVSQIPLPSLSSIAYTKFIPTSQQQQQQHKAIELARQRIVNDVRQSAKDVIYSFLPIVRIGKDDAALWIFAIGGGKGKERAGLTALEELEGLALDGLQQCQLSQFTPSTLYPCSSQCAKLPTACAYCTRTTPSDSSIQRAQAPTSSSPITLLPRVPLRPIYALFVDAVRDRLIDDICSASHQAAGSNGNAADPQTWAPRRMPSATRLGKGFLSGSDGIVPVWGDGWEHRFRKRPLVHTALDVFLSPTAIHIRPLPTLTTLLPVLVSYSAPPPHSTGSSSPSFTTSNSPPLTPGTPLILAPYPTPAFYVSTHAGASVSSSLITPFWDALGGLGASSLPACPRYPSPRSSSSSPNPTSLSTAMSSANLTREAFILAFIPLYNPQGEHKGITALWPAHLAFIDTSPSRLHLTNLPEMPETEMLLTPPRGSATQTPAQASHTASTPPPPRRRSTDPGPLHRLNRTQRAFRALELSSHKRVPGVPIHATAKNAAGYVESVAREREKERERANQERMRREREMKEGKPSTSGPSAPPNPNTNASQVVQSANNTSVAGSSPPKTVVDTARAGSGWNSASANFFAKAAQGNADSFYPSPPDWDPVASASGPGVTEHPTVVRNLAGASASSSTDVSSSSTAQPQHGSDVAAQESLDLTTSINLGMDIDINDMSMSMGINLDDTMAMMDVNMGVDMDATGMMDGGFGSFAEAFTDDDFNFFDTTPPGEAMPVAVSDMHHPNHHLGADEDAVDGWLTNGLASTDQIEDVGVSHQLQPVTPASASADVAAHESLLPHPLDGVQMSEDDGDLLPPPPDLMPSSPAKSPWSPGNPPTPSLELNTPPDPAIGKAMFEPIAFGKRHRVADGKYRDAKGKFAFPNILPRPSPTENVTLWSPGSPSSDKEDGWKLRYDAVTDPRVGVVNRLRGVKRKLPEKAQYSKTVKGRDRDEEWESIYDQDEDADEPESSSSEEEDDMEEIVAEQGRDDDSSSYSHPSRPSTPPPPGLPLTATLLYSHFHHAHMLTLGVPMRPSYGDLVPNNDPPPAPISVPTPVSPAAALGSAAERNKTLELLAQAVAKEAVENDVWAEAWGLSSDAPSTVHAARVGREVSQTDLRQILDLMGKVDGLKGPLPLSSLLEPPVMVTPTPPNPAHGNNVQLMHPPWLSVGRAGLVHHMLPPAIRFWEKEGLGPRGGTKDVVAFALFEEGDERSILVEAWMERVGRAYSARGFGAHVAGSAGTFERGLVPLQFEAVRKTLPNLISALPSQPRHIVIYVIAPPSVCSSLKSPALRSIIMSQKRVSKLPGQHDFDQSRILVHFVPDHLVADPYTHPTTRHVGLERFVNSVYDRLLRPTLRQTSRQFWQHNPAFENRFQVPAYVLARKTPPQTHLQWDEHPSLNVLDRHTFLQVGYRFSECKKWLLAACIDERGEAHDVAVWGVPNQNESPALWVVSNIWIFAMQFVQRAHNEWRIVVSKLGEMDESEVEAWTSYLETVVSAHTGPAVHVSLVCAQNDMPLAFLCPSDTVHEAPQNVPNEPSSVFADVCSATYSAFLPGRTPIISPDLLCPSDHPSLVPAEEDTDAAPAPIAPIGILPLCTTALFRVPNDTDFTTIETLYIHLLYTYKSAKSTLKKTTHEVHADITRNWHELAVLTRERWHFSQHGELPFHLAALELMSNVLDPEVLTPDAKDMEYLGG